MAGEPNFHSFFVRATRIEDGPYPYQERLATSDDLPQLLDVPTGVGKTAAAILAWLYRRRVHPDEAVRSSAPRRLVYCLPMRTLVDQTAGAARDWLCRLGFLADEPGDEQPLTGWAAQYDPDGKRIAVSILMGGEDAGDWYLSPARDAILIGTQDMLLSRALNRGYGMSRYAWPIEFALLNNDCQWILDETQLMGVGLETSAQLAGFREELQTFGHSRTLWMSATLNTQQLQTVDHPPPQPGGWNIEKLGEDDESAERVRLIKNAKKPIQQLGACRLQPGKDQRSSWVETLAAEIISAHRRGTLALAVLNRVDRAQEVYRSIIDAHDEKVETHLIHSRFRPYDRETIQDQALDESTIAADGPGRIVIATQAIEAGVDVSATTMFTELAPWSSLVQRFGRCNRRGVCGEEGRPAAQIFWMDIDTENAAKSKEIVLPYAAEDLDRARECLADLQDAGPASLEQIHVDEPAPIPHVIRRKDLLDLFDTTPDLSGNDLDVSRYIRDSDDTDLQLYWRDWPLDNKRNKKTPPPLPDGEADFPAPSRRELCSVSVAAMRDFLKKLKKQDTTGWGWDPLDKEWRAFRPDEVRPGMTVLLHVTAGGYDARLGWTGDSKHQPVQDVRPDDGEALDSMDNDDTRGAGRPQTLAAHVRCVIDELQELQGALQSLTGNVDWDALERAAWWHDVGKAHPAFQSAMRAAAPVRELDPHGEQVWAKSGTSGRLRYFVVDPETEREIKRTGFRHELVSALAWLNQHNGEDRADLIAYLIAAHHGKVRLSIRSMPNENRPADPTVRFARGIWEGDRIPQVKLGNGETVAEFEINLELMELGESEHWGASWLERTIRLRDELGPLRLAYLESLLRIADRLGSEKGEQA